MPHPTNRPPTVAVRHFFFALALAAGSVVAAQAVTPAYVRTDGDDTLCDGSADQSAASAPTCAFASLAKAVEDVDADGVIEVGAGTFDDAAQVVFDKSVTVQGTGQATTIFTHATFDTGSSGDARGWWLVQAGVVLHVRDLTLDGVGRQTYQAVRQRGSGSFERVTFRNILFPTYQGTAVAAFGDGPTHVDECTFHDIGRIGVLFFGAGVSTSTASSSTYTGKGAGDHLDYAFEINGGAIVNIVRSVITDNLGEASSDGSKSSGVLVSTFFGAGSFATLTGNDISGSTTAVNVGRVPGDTDTARALVIGNNLHGNVEQGLEVGGLASVDAELNCITENGIGVRLETGSGGMFHNNNIVHNTVGVQYSGPADLEFENNWWAEATGPSGDGPGGGDPVDGASGGGSVDFDPFLASPETMTPTCNVLPVELLSFSVD